MKVIVAGSRSIDDRKVVRDAIFDAPFIPKDGEIVTGGARGVDQRAKEFAHTFKQYDYTEFPADWDEHGKAAGPIRNSKMAEYADALVAVWDGESSGTRDMIEKALNVGLPVYVEVIE